MVQSRIPLKDGNVVLYSSPNLGISTQDLFKELYENTPWEQRSIVIYGKEVQQPRLIAWYSDHSYTYSGLRLEPRPLTPRLFQLKELMTDLCGSSFNGVLLNLYPDGQSSIGMHADDEPEFGPNPTIASLSLGAARRFDLKTKQEPILSTNILLTDGSVLVMAGSTQKFWKHGIAKTSTPIGPRINLTFRNITVQK